MSWMRICPEPISYNVRDADSGWTLKIMTSGKKPKKQQR